MATHEIVMGFGIEPKERLHYTQEPGWEARTIRLVSGLSHNYREVTKVPDGIASVEGPQAGERAPDALLVKEPQKRAYDVFRHPRFTLLVIPGKNPTADIEAARKLRDALAPRFGELVATHLISDAKETGFDFDHQTPDETGELAQRYRVGTEGRFVLVRPDLYVALSCLPKDADAVSAVLEGWFSQEN